MKIPILFEDNQILVINKPSGVVVNRAESVKEETIQDWAENTLKIDGRHPYPPIRRGRIPSAYIKQSGFFGAEDPQNDKEEKNDFYNRAGIVHRLDKDTSGILLIAKTPKSFQNLQKQFADRVIKKTYQTLVSGLLPSKTGEVRLPVGRLPHGRGKFGIVPFGRESVTKYSQVQSYNSKYGIYSFLEVNPETGRTHQIRVHLKHLGYPVVGDVLYGGRNMLKSAEEFCPRLFLHAAKITFVHPESAGEMTIECPLPEELKKVLNHLII